MESATLPDFRKAGSRGERGDHRRSCNWWNHRTILVSPDVAGTVAVALAVHLTDSSADDTPLHDRRSPLDPFARSDPDQGLRSGITPAIRIR